MDLAAFDMPVESGSLRRRIGIGAKTPLIGILGRLSPEKGHRFFVEAAAYVASQRADVHFVIAGEEAQIKADDLREEARALGLEEERLHFLGRWCDVRMLIADLDIGVIASLYSEAVCRIAMEYMAMSKPIIGTAVNVIPEMIDHQHSGWIVPPGDSAAMAEAMLTMLHDRAQAKTWGLAGRRKLERTYSQLEFTTQTERIFAQLLARTHRV
jgi:glycosyltransferase involved in cell wall biosynthesis